MHDKAIRQSWLAFYDRVRTEYLDLLLAARLAGPHAQRDALQAANCLLEAFEGVKLRALFEPAICADPAEEDRIVKNLMSIAGLASVKSAAVPPSRM